MNIQAMMKQAQAIQKNMMQAKEEIDNTTFENTTSFVTVSAKGNRKIEKVVINKDNLDSDDVEMLQDMLVVAINNVMKQIDEETENKMGKYTQGMPGLF